MKWVRLTLDHRFLQMMRSLYIPSLWINQQAASFRRHADCRDMC